MLMVCVLSFVHRVPLYCVITEIVMEILVQVVLDFVQ